MKLIIATCLVAISVNNIIPVHCVTENIDIDDRDWEMFKIENGKEYKDQTTEEFRKQIFLDNKHKIDKHNKLYSNKIVTYQLQINTFSDRTGRELVGSPITVDKMKKSFRGGLWFRKIPNFVLPKEVDWRKRGLVTRVREQGSCDTCWAFSAAGALEGQQYRKTGRLVELSVQNLIDCARRTPSIDDCKGGEYMSNAFIYVIRNNGVDTEQSYPYEGRTGRCRFNPQTVGATARDFVNIYYGDEDALAQAVALVGPVSAAISVETSDLRFYKQGVYTRIGNPNRPDHAVLVVGFGSDRWQGDYWLVKNSWGPEWGENGYVRIARNKSNTCGIATVASYPLI